MKKIDVLIFFLGLTFTLAVLVNLVVVITYFK
jgi:hypothetical protein